MPAVLTEVVAAPAAARKQWTRSEFEALSESGVLHDQKLELIEGELVDRMGTNPPHANSSLRFHYWLQIVFGFHFVYRETAMDVAVSDSELNLPVPDLFVLRRDISHFESSRPGPADVRMVAEVADSTVRFDLSVKASLYARASIPEYWVLDINRRRMVVHREPEGGSYRSVMEYGELEHVTPLAAPESALLVAEVLPKSIV